MKNFFFQSGNQDNRTKHYQEVNKKKQKRNPKTKVENFFFQSGNQDNRTKHYQEVNKKKQKRNPKTKVENFFLPKWKSR